jgi:hypothetical protein
LRREALAAFWNDMPVQHCTVHKHRNLLARARERLHEENGRQSLADKPSTAA